VFMGYLGSLNDSKAGLDDEHNLHSGDLAREENGFYYITGRYCGHH